MGCRSLGFDTSEVAETGAAVFFRIAVQNFLPEAAARKSNPGAVPPGSQSGGQTPSPGLRAEPGRETCSLRCALLRARASGLDSYPPPARASMEDRSPD